MIKAPLPLKTQVTAFMLWLAARLLLATYRIEVLGQQHRDHAAALHAQGSFCIALWHEHLFASILAHHGQRFAPLASLSHDGDLVTRVMDRFGFQTVRGSSSRGGGEARDGLVASTGDGWFTALTVDGPRGPRRRVKGGIIDIARRTGVAVLPLTTIASSHWILSRSWDQFKIPKPFAKIVVSYGAPVFVAPSTQGLAFGTAKSQVRSGLATAEAAAQTYLQRRALRAPL